VRWGGGAATYDERTHGGEDGRRTFVPLWERSLGRSARREVSASVVDLSVDRGGWLLRYAGETGLLLVRAALSLRFAAIAEPRVSKV
jgi:hypothetical protein